MSTDFHPNHYGDKPLHDSDRIVSGHVRVTTVGAIYEVTHCKHCGCAMTRPVSNRAARVAEIDRRQAR